MSTKSKAAQISKAGGDFELVERDISEPGAGQVRVKVEACGVCHSDALVKDGIWPTKIPNFDLRIISAEVTCQFRWFPSSTIGFIRLFPYWSK